MSTYVAALRDVRAAAARLEGRVHRTPVLRSRTLDALAGRRVYLKCENLQRAGAFKIRGALHAVLRLPEAVAPRGVVTHSSGNHGQALALAAREAGIPATVVVPRNAPEVKLRAMEGYGARLVRCEPTLAAREATAARVVAETGATLIPPYDHPDVIAGQGTIALELAEQVPDADAVVAPVGGGGLVSGLALALRELRPEVRVLGAEPAGADDAHRSKRAGHLLPMERPITVADGLRTSLGGHTWPVVRDLVREVYRVEEAEIRAALRFLLERVKVVVEPSAAVGLAAVLTESFRRAEDAERVAVVLSGGNLELAALGELLG